MAAQRGGSAGGTRFAIRRVVVGYRVVGAAWLCLLGTTSLVAGTPRPGVVLGTMGLVAAWAALTAAVARRSPPVLGSTAWLAADLAVAGWTVAAPTVAGGGTPAFYGGYPFSAVLVAVAARRLPGGLVAAAVLSVVAGLRFLSGGVATVLSEVNNTVLIYVLGAGVLSWGIGTIRRAEAERLRVEAALAEERAERRRSQERAETAAHLHDSVLQTLALIQRRSGDAAAVTSLARRQERELREWLRGPRAAPSTAATGFREALEGAAAEVERDHALAVETVVVGDAAADDDVLALVAAAREALVNAAKHGGVGRAALYGEAGDDGLEVYVRDRGAGFDPGAVPADRRGISESIVGRLARHGGTGAVSSTPGAGTEVELRLPRDAPPPVHG